jgi:tetratricopeptide (TPR) repeat protein
MTSARSRRTSESDDERAIEAYERVLGWEPANAIASRELEKLFWGREQWERLVALLLDRASRHSDLSTLESVAQLYEDKLGDARAAFLVWLTIFRREPRPQLVEHLDRLAPMANAWDELIGECGVLAEEHEAKHPEAAASVWHVVGRWLRDRTSSLDGAVRALDRALRLVPADVDTLYELLDLLRTTERWTELAALLSERAELETDPQRRGELYAELGEIHETQLGQVGDAIAFYERALASEPESAAVLVALHRAYLATEAWSTLGELLPRLVDALAGTAPSSVIVDLHVELGVILADHLGRPAEAANAFRDALAVDPDNSVAYQGLERALQSAGDATALPMRPSPRSTGHRERSS